MSETRIPLRTAGWALAAAVAEAPTAPGASHGSDEPRSDQYRGFCMHRAT